MIKYIFRRIASWVLLILIAVNLTYFLAASYLKPRSFYEQRRPPLPPADIDALLNKYNMNDRVPIVERWWTWLSDVVTKWNWGYSKEGQWVNEQVGFRMWVSAQLVLAAFILAIVVGVSIGVYTASRQYSIADRSLQVMSSIIMNIHIIVLCVAVTDAAIGINNWVKDITQSDFTLFYVTGQGGDVEGFFPKIFSMLQHGILPTIALVIFQYSSYHLTQRSLLLDNINADYVRTARAKGLTRTVAIRRHALRTSIIPIAFGAAFGLPAVFTGAVMTEKVFAWRGMGDYLITTIAEANINGAVAVAAFQAVCTAVGAVLADIVVVFLDPRVRVS